MWADTENLMFTLKGKQTSIARGSLHFNLWTRTCEVYKA